MCHLSSRVGEKHKVKCHRATDSKSTHILYVRKNKQNCCRWTKNTCTLEPNIMIWVFLPYAKDHNNCRNVVCMYKKITEEVGSVIKGLMKYFSMMSEYKWIRRLAFCNLVSLCHCCAFPLPSQPPMLIHHSRESWTEVNISLYNVHWPCTRHWPLPMLPSLSLVPHAAKQTFTSECDLASLNTFLKNRHQSQKIHVVILSKKLNKINR